MKILKVVEVAAVALVALFLTAAPAFAADAPTPTSVPGGVSVLSGSGMGAGLGAALTIIGAGYGFGRIGSAALESMARQPEAAGRIQTAMIVIAALLEGATFFALIVCIGIPGKANF